MTYPVETVLPHLAAPIALTSDGSFAWLQQDTLAEVAQSVEVICGTTIGDRTVVPTFGTPDQTFAEPVVANPISIAIGQWEPRATAVVTVTNPGPNAAINVAVDLAKGTL